MVSHAAVEDYICPSTHAQAQQPAELSRVRKRAFRIGRTRQGNSWRTRLQPKLQRRPHSAMNILAKGLPNARSATSARLSPENLPALRRRRKGAMLSDAAGGCNVPCTAVRRRLHGEPPRHHCMTALHAPFHESCTPPMHGHLSGLSHHYYTRSLEEGAVAVVLHPRQLRQPRDHVRAAHHPPHLGGGVGTAGFRLHNCQLQTQLCTAARAPRHCCSARAPFASTFTSLLNPGPHTAHPPAGWSRQGPAPAGW